MDSGNIDSEPSLQICSISETSVNWYIQCHNTSSFKGTARQSLALADLYRCVRRKDAWGIYIEN